MNFPIVLWDTEYTSWEGCQENGWNEDADQYKELVQIGAARISKTEVLDTFSQTVKPKINPCLSEYFVNLTGIEQPDVSDEPMFEEVWNEFEIWRNGNDAYAWCNDISIIKYNKELYDSDILIDESDFYDSRELLKDLGFPVDKFEYSGNVHKHIDKDLDISEHNAADDALSVAYTVIEMLSEESNI